MYNFLISYYFSILFDVLHEEFGLKAYQSHRLKFTAFSIIPLNSPKINKKLI